MQECKYAGVGLRYTLEFHKYARVGLRYALEFHKYAAGVTALYP